MDKLIAQAIKNCNITKYYVFFEEVCIEYKRLLDERNKQRGKLFSAEQIKQKLLKINPSIIENSGKTNPFIHQDIKDWHNELENLNTTENED